MDIGHLTWRKSSFIGAVGNCVEVAHVPVWRKSSFSGANSNCVEVAHVPEWRKSSYTSASGGNCVEVAEFPAASIAVRDSKGPDGAKLVFPAPEWRAFISGIKAGEFGLS